MVTGLNSSSLWAESAVGSSYLKGCLVTAQGLADEGLVVCDLVKNVLLLTSVLFVPVCRKLVILGPATAVKLSEGDKTGHVGKWGKAPRDQAAVWFPSSHLLFFFSPSSPPLTRTHSYGVITTLWHCPHCPVGWEGIRGGGCRVRVSLLTGVGPGSMSGDMCNESDSGLDVLATQGARL